MAQVTKRVTDPLLIGRYAEFKSVKATSPEQPRLCSKHHEAVTVQQVPFNNHGAPTPNLELVFSGCCEEAITQEFEFIDNTLAKHYRSGDA